MVFSEIFTILKFNNICYLFWTLYYFKPTATHYRINQYKNINEPLLLFLSIILITYRYITGFWGFGVLGNGRSQRFGKQIESDFTAAHVQELRRNRG